MEDNKREKSGTHKIPPDRTKEQPRVLGEAVYIFKGDSGELPVTGAQFLAWYNQTFRTLDL